MSAKSAVQTQRDVGTIFEGSTPELERMVILRVACLTSPGTPEDEIHRRLGYAIPGGLSSERDRINDILARLAGFTLLNRHPHLRRGFGLAAPPKQPIPDDLRWQVWERDNFTCQKCGSRRRLSIDHILAESKGGPTEEWNLQTLCRSCNSRKGAR